MNSVDRAVITPDPEGFSNLPVGREAVLRFLIQQPSLADETQVTLRIGDRLYTAEVCKKDYGSIHEAEFLVQLPDTVGAHPWKITLGRDEASCEGVLDTRPLRVRLMSFGSPDLVTEERRVHFHVTARCLDGVSLAGSTVEIFDLQNPSSVRVRCRLLDEPEPGTEGLYRADVDLEVPGEGGLHQFGVRLEPDALRWPWDAPDHTFSIERVLGERHDVHFTVVDQEDGSALSGVAIRAGRHRATTDADGKAILKLPPGQAKVTYYLAHYNFFDTQIEISGPLEMTVRGKKEPPIPEPWEY